MELYELGKEISNMLHELEDLRRRQELLEESVKQLYTLVEHNLKAKKLVEPKEEKKEG